MTFCVRDVGAAVVVVVAAVVVVGRSGGGGRPTTEATVEHDGDSGWALVAVVGVLRLWMFKSIRPE